MYENKFLYSEILTEKLIYQYSYNKAKVNKYNALEEISK